MFHNKEVALGIMSGSSIDGLDIGLFNFSNELNSSFEIIKTKTYEIPEELKKDLFNSDKLNKQKIEKLDIIYGEFIGITINRFLKETIQKPSIIGLHGHTIFHEPDKGFSLQIGNGQIVSNLTGIQTVVNFRNKDISLGGQGAPLVPFGEVKLFKNYDAFINFGGIANITIPKKTQAFDIGYCNRALNYFANQLDLDYDKNGNIARLGKANPDLINALSEESYHFAPPPKSLNNQDFERKILPIISNFNLSIEDNLSTYNVFFAKEIAKYIEKDETILVSGGGARNSFLINHIEAYSEAKLTIPKETIIDFKEALIFAFMALKRKNKEINVLSAYTGAKEDTSSGDIYFPV